MESACLQTEDVQMQKSPVTEEIVSLITGLFVCAGALFVKRNRLQDRQLGIAAIAQLLYPAQLY